ncbi:MAG: polysaccharide biosynthesis protein [Calditrichaeota bacterium]|nr:polysaccharide biosynthesis protein [Calditrichota bacterium]
MLPKLANRIKSLLPRNLLFIFFDGISFIISIYLSYAIKFGLKEEVHHFPYEYAINAVFLFLIVKFAVFYKLKLYYFNWKYVSISDFYNLIKASIINFAIIFIVYFVGYSAVPEWLPKSVIVTDFFISLLLVGSIRISYRFFFEVLNTKRKNSIPTLIVGAGASGEMIIRDLSRGQDNKYRPERILDNDSKLWGSLIHNIPITGGLDDFEKSIAGGSIKAVIIADTNIDLQTKQQIFMLTQKYNIKDVKVVPRLYSTASIDITVKNLEEINIEDLINRSEVKINASQIRTLLSGKKVFITGAAGSIGSEIVRQVLSFNPEKVILFELDETEVFHFEIELNQKFPDQKNKIEYIIGDIRDYDRILETMSQFKPDIIFTTAAYKHVPLMEFNPGEAIKVNIFGIYNICRAAIESGVKQVVNISTDKAVNPSSVMGMTKRIGEYIAQSFNDISETSFVSVRFGNVLGSRGSVLPTFLEQIRKGGPITITHPDMKRYFMTISEAVLLVLQAAVIGRGGEVMVLDMGEPIYIKDLAHELIKLHNLEEERDIQIVYSGIRPGEKLFEEILTSEEGTDSTQHERIHIAKISKHFSYQEIIDLLESLKTFTKSKKTTDEQKTELKLILDKVGIYNGQKVSTAN